MYFITEKFIKFILAQDGTNIPEGKYSYPFQFTLPLDIPSSLEGSHYNIRYSIKATVDRPWKFDYEAEANFKVFSLIDLNNIPNVKVS